METGSRQFLFQWDLPFGELHIYEDERLGLF